MDHATLTDNSGRKADFRNVVLILTSNAGSREMATKTIGFSDTSVGQNLDEALQRVAAGRQMAAIVIDELERRFDGRRPRNGVTPAMLATMT